MQLQLMIVDDHPLVREGLRMVLEGDGIAVVAEATDGEDAFRQLQNHSVDVAVVDVQMPLADGYRFLDLLRGASLQVPVVMHTVQNNAETLHRCRELGAAGLVTKGDEPGLLQEAIRAASAGWQFWNGVATRDFDGVVTPRRPAPAGPAPEDEEDEVDHN